MFQSKKVIPQLAVMSLALTGCGDSSGGGGGAAGTGGAGGSGAAGGAGGAGGESPAEVIEQFCMKLVECYEGYTQQSCEEVYSGYLENAPERCVPFFATYLGCVSELSCDEVLYGAQSCEDEAIEEFGQELVQECS